MDGSVGTSTSVEDLIGQLVAAGYRVTFEPKRRVYGIRPPGFNIVIEAVRKEEPRELGSFHSMVGEFVTYHELPASLPLVLHPDPVDPRSTIVALEESVRRFVPREAGR